MNDLEKRQKIHRKKQKGMSPFCYMSPIIPDKGNPKAMETFNNSTSGEVSSDAGTMGEDYNSSPYLQERRDLISRIKKYYPNFSGKVKGKELSNYQLQGMLNRLNKSKPQVSRFDDDDDYEPKPNYYINDPKFNYDDPERQDEYEVENLSEQLRKLDRDNFRNDLPNYDLEGLYEGMKDRLTPEDRRNINDAVMKNDSAEILRILTDDEDKKTAEIKEAMIDGQRIPKYEDPSYPYFRVDADTQQIATTESEYSAFLIALDTIRKYYDKYDRIEIYRIDYSYYGDEIEENLEWDSNENLPIELIRNLLQKYRSEKDNWSWEELDVVYNDICDKYEKQYEEAEFIADMVINILWKESDKNPKNQINESYDPELLDELVNHYKSYYYDSLSDEDASAIYDEIINQYGDSLLADDVINELYDMYGYEESLKEDSDEEENVIDDFLTELSTRQIKEIYNFLDDCGGYTDYNQKVEDVRDNFNLSKFAAESIVWDWTIRNESIIREDLDIDSYTELNSTIEDNGKLYKLFRKSVDGKGKWATAPINYGDVDYDNAFEITYEQALGYEPLSNIGKLSRKLGKALLPEEYEDDVDLIQYADVDDSDYKPQKDYFGDIKTYDMIGIGTDIANKASKEQHIWVDLVDADEGTKRPLGLKQLVFEVDGDWKHDHLRFDLFAKKFLNDHGYSVVKKWEEEIGNSESDDYKANHYYLVTHDEDVANEFSNMSKLFN